MNKFFTLALSALFVLTVAVTAQAQDGPALNLGGGDGGAIGADVYGELNLAWLNRDAELNEVSTGGTSTTGGWTGNSILGFGFDFSDNVSALLELATLQYGAAGINYFGGGNNGSAGHEVDVEQAWINLSGFFSANLNIRIGVQHLSYTLREEDSGSFYLGTNAATSGLPGNGAAWMRGGTGSVDPAGLVIGLTDNAQDSRWTLDFVHVVLLDDANGGQERDDTLTGFFFRYLFGEGSNFDANLAYYHGDVGGATSDAFGILDIGAGINWRNVADIQGLHPFVEVHFQNGDLDDDISAGGLAFRLGGRWYLQNQNGNPWVELSYWSISGDDDGTDEDADSYSAMESNEEFAIMESRMGTDTQSNYSAVKISGGMTTSLNVTGAPQSDDNLAVTLRIGFFNLEEEITIGGNDEDGLGTEVDLEARWSLTSSLDVVATLAFLFGSDVLEGSTVEEEDSTELFLLGTELGF